MRHLFFLSIFLLALPTVKAQKISSSFDAIIRCTPGALRIIQHIDGNYLVYGDINYYGTSRKGSILKVDQNGNLVSGFPNVYTDQPIQSAAVLASGKILIQGWFQYLNGERVGNLALLNADGTRDPNFQINSLSTVTGFAVQSTGKIILYSNPTSSGTATIYRINPDGTTDGTFTAPGVIDFVQSLVVAPDDKLYVNNNIKALRLNSNGSVDNTFATFQDPMVGMGTSAVQPDGKLLLSTSTYTLTPVFSMTYSLTRLNVNGTVDNTFNAGPTSAQIMSIVIRKSGKIAVTGLLVSFNSQNGNAFELNLDGSVNKVLLSTDYNGLYSISEDASENIFVTGGFREINNSIRKRYIVKIKSNYQIDLAFKAPVSRIAGSTTFMPLAYQSGGKIIVGGGFEWAGVELDSNKLVRLLPNGSLDPTFNAAIRKNTVHTSVSHLAVQQNGKILVGGAHLFETSSTNFGRLLPDGQVDNTFTVGLGPTNNFNAGAIQALRIHNGNIYMSGIFDAYNLQPSQSFVILNADGVKIGPQQNGLLPNSYIQDMEIQSDGKVIFMGTFPITGGGTKSFVRLNVDGTLDNTFTLSLTGNPVDFDLDANDNIVVSGNYLDLDPNPKILKRFDKNGVVDNSFTAGSNFDVPFTGYFVKHISGERMLIGGSFLGYQGTQSPGLVLLDKTGALLPLENPYDSSSNSIKATVDNNTVYMIGRFSRNHGQDFRGVSKMIFPLTTAASNLTAEVSSSSQINLSWTGVPTGADRIVLERSTPDNQHYQPLASLPITQSTYQDKDLKEVTQYYYKLSSANDEYQSPTLEDFDETLIAPQTALPASEITDESFVANWVYVEGTDSCMLQISLNNFVSFVADYENAIVKTGSKSVTGLESGKAYQYRVKRFKNGKSSDFSAPITVNVIVGLENEFQNGVSVFPNPATDRVMIALPAHIGDVDVRIYDSVGKCVDVSLLEAGTTSAIDLDKFQPGVYIITVAMVGQVQKFKLIKRK